MSASYPPDRQSAGHVFGQGPFDPAGSQGELLAKAMSPVAKKVRELSEAEWGPKQSVDIIGLSSSFTNVLSKVEKIARYNEPVLVTGESGVGKESIAQAIYLLSNLRGKPFASVNCPQYCEGNLTVSELFGHRKGSFTGAVEDRKGVFEAAHGGVIFLDEIADLHLDAQAMLLRALASGEFRRIGDQTPRRADVRVVAATNRRLDELVVADQFRNDLYFRLRYFLLHVPPLRERGDDWRMLLEYSLAKLRQRYGVAKRLSPEALKMLESYDWPGNIRQLISVATMGYAMADGDIIEPDHFENQIEISAATEDVVGETLRRIIDGRESFWDVVYHPFMARDLNRAQVMAVVRRGLTAAHGSYRRLLDQFHLQESEYQKFMDFLRHHRLKP
jgi:DNA-binding NtrC family response regulator